MILEVLTVLSMMTGRPGTQLSTDMSVCPAVYGCSDVSGNIIHMRPYLAAMLEDLPHVPPYQAVPALLTFCHEARHVRDISLASRPATEKDELIAQNWSIYHAPIIARLLGASKEWTAKMKKWIPFWVKNVIGY